MTWTSKPDFGCLHHNVAFQHRNVHFKDTEIHYLEMVGCCMDCNKPVEFQGVPTFSKDSPSSTEDKQMIRLPFVCK
jgi:hypothetical protein